MMRPLKKGAGTRKTTPLIFRGGGTLIDPVEELWRMVSRDVLPPGTDLNQVPLFRNVSSGSAFRTSDVRSVVQWLMRSIGQDPAVFGAHSLRIGGATAALAGGVQPATIRLMGRWSSDVYEVYVRVSRQAAAAMTTLVGSTAFHDIERGAFHDEELEVLSGELDFELEEWGIEEDAA